ncbi:MAG: efflux RND transporter periplasmic adaptor subunit [Flavobacteriaceae bacterium]|nr:efflux RND transporter periplasmic adaptor subunit [Flavobacteriaceae bacterium]
MKVRLQSNLSTIKAGIQTVYPITLVSNLSVEAFCQVDYNRNNLAQISPLASGVIQKILVEVGKSIKQGETLLEINSTTLGEIKSSYLSSVVDYQIKQITFERESQLVKEKFSASREYEVAKASRDIAFITKKNAYQKLLNYGLSQNEIVQIEKEQDSSSSYVIKAPFSGTIIARNAVIGEVVKPGQVLFSLAQLQNFWLDLSIPSKYLAHIKTGLGVIVEFDGLPGKFINGNLSWVSTSIDKNSHMVKARAIIANIDGVLKAGMFGRSQVILKRGSNNLHVPKDAIQYFEGKPYLFVKEEEDLYELRRVILGNETPTQVEIVSKIQEREKIVVKGSFTMMSEFLKSKLGAGCVDD